MVFWRKRGSAKEREKRERGEERKIIFNKWKKALKAHKSSHSQNHVLS